MNATPKRLDEPFGSDDEDFVLMHREWSKVDDGLKNAGVRQGLESSQDHSVQDGFNSAFREAVQMAMAAGRLQGSISGLLSWPSPATESEGGATVKLQPELLTKTTELLSGIPQILMSSAVDNSETREADKVTSTGVANIAQDVTLGKCPAETDARDRGRDCEQICSSRRHFWNQLESFRVQARPLGVFTAQH